MDKITSSKKYQAFKDGPIDGKPVSAIPGVGKKAESHFQAKGITKATQPFGEFLVQGQDKEKLAAYMGDNGRLNALNVKRAVAGIDGFCENNIRTLK